MGKVLDIYVKAKQFSEKKAKQFRPKVQYRKGSLKQLADKTLGGNSKKSYSKINFKYPKIKEPSTPDYKKILEARRLKHQARLKK